MRPICTKLGSVIKCLAGCAGKKIILFRHERASSPPSRALYVRIHFVSFTFTINGIYILYTALDRPLGHTYVALSKLNLSSECTRGNINIG